MPRAKNKDKGICCDNCATSFKLPLKYISVKINCENFSFFCKSTIVKDAFSISKTESQKSGLHGNLQLHGKNKSQNSCYVTSE